eukprot:5139083-Pleurochrysis_carterae.AAC.5
MKSGRIARVRSSRVEYVAALDRRCGSRFQLELDVCGRNFEESAWLVPRPICLGYTLTTDDVGMMRPCTARSLWSAAPRLVSRINRELGRCAAHGACHR